VKVYVVKIKSKKDGWSDVELFSNFEESRAYVTSLFREFLKDLDMTNFNHEWSIETEEKEVV